MKKYTFGILFLSAALFAACSLEENPKSKFTEEDAVANPSLTYLNTVASVYSAIGNGLYGATDNVHTLGEFTSDATMLPGRQGDWVDGGKWQNIFLHNFNPSVDTYNGTWEHLYRIIGLCNSSIDKLKELMEIKENADFVTEYQDNIYELRALRAIYYYYAMDIFAEVPIVESSTSSIADVEQKHRSAVFQFVVDELTECLPHLSDAMSQNEGLYYGRVTQPVAYMCLAKCAINAPVFNVDNTSSTSYQGFVGPDKSGSNRADESLGANVSNSGRSITMKVDGTDRNAWNTVIYCVEKLEEMGYDLQPRYADNFAVKNETSVENIFTRPNDDKIYKIEDYNPSRSLHYNHAGNGVLPGGGWNGACATVHQMKIYGYGTANEDPRLRLNFFVEKEYISDTETPVEDGATVQDLEYLPLEAVVDFANAKETDSDAVKNALAHNVKCAGARMKKYERDKTTTTQHVYNNDLVIWRYGDALLLKAEAEYRLGNTGEALTDLNRIRNRAGAQELTSLTLNDILNERMLELAWEGVRRQDQVRFCTFTQPTEDRYTGVWHNASAGDYNDDTEGYTCVYPIPQSVLDLNKNLKQNPGY